MRIVILGAGFGGLELSTRLSQEFGVDVDVVLIDKADGFVFGFSKLDVMFGRTTVEHVVHGYADLVKPGVTFINEVITSIDAHARTVTTETHELAADILVVALGADLNPAATPGLVESGNEFYTVPGAFALRDKLADFNGGRVIVGVTSTPFKCPPAPSEAALLMHDLLAAKGVLESSQITLVMPFGVPIPPSPDASAALLQEFERRGIAWLPGEIVKSLDGGRQVAVLASGAELSYDLFLGVPVHVAPDVVIEAGMTVDGWIPVDPLTLETQFTDVYAIGDVTSVGTPKAGVFAEGQATVVADRIIARVRGQVSTRTYDGHGICYLEFGSKGIGMVDVTFLAGKSPSGALVGPSTDLIADKVEFGRSRIDRWFGRAWQPL